MARGDNAATWAVKPPSAPTVHNVVVALRERILAMDSEHAFLGSEPDLCADLGVSRPTLRQAVRVLEQEQLITVRRGVNGGYYTRKPSPEAVAEFASVYLRSVHASAADLSRAQGVITLETIVLAMERGSDAELQSLVDFVAEYQAKSRSGERRWFHEVTIDFNLLLADIARSPTLGLFTNILGTLGVMPLRLDAFATEKRRDEVRTFHRKLADAIARRDADRALALARKQHQTTLRLLKNT
jgi:DNA-binding FadR family transcriptional regulator